MLLYNFQKPYTFLKFFVEKFTKKGVEILEFFTGSASLPMVCMDLKRKYVCFIKLPGYEVFPEQFMAAKDNYRKA